MHLIPHLTQILQILLLRIGLNLIHSLHRLPLNVGVLSLYLHVRNINVLFVLVFQVDDELVHGLELVDLYCVVDVAG